MQPPPVLDRGWGGSHYRLNNRQGTAGVYARPRTIEEATRAMATPGALALGGGTDVSKVAEALASVA